MRILNRVIYSRIKPCKLRPLPPEIWLLVFETGDLDINDMSNVRLTCALFAALGKIQTFSSLKISPLVLCGDYVNYPKSLANYFADKLRKRQALQFIGLIRPWNCKGRWIDPSLEFQVVLYI